MADLIRHMEEGHETADIDGVIDEVAEARGTYDSLDERLDAMGDAPSPSSSTPVMDGTGAAGSSDDYARADHVHPHDTTKQDTLAFEGTYNASTNKAATMADIKDGVLTGYEEADSKQALAATDKVVEAFGKLEKRADLNETNILLNETLYAQYAIKLNKNLINSASGENIRWVDIPVSLQAGTYQIGFATISGTLSTESQVSCYTSNYDTLATVYLDKGNNQTATVNVNGKVSIIRLYAGSSSSQSENQRVSYTTAFACPKAVWDIDPTISAY